MIRYFKLFNTLFLFLFLISQKLLHHHLLYDFVAVSSSSFSSVDCIVSVINSTLKNQAFMYEY